MGLFNKLFGDKSKIDNPDNTKLLALLDQYWKEDGRGDTYKNVVLELMNGNSFLMFPTQNESFTEPDKWSSTDKETTMHLASVINLDGLKVMGAFTDEAAMLSWTKKPCQYTAMRAKDVLKFVEDNGMDRIVINSDHYNMFVLERTRENIKTHHILKGTQVLLGTPDRPLSNTITQKLIENFKRNNTILEVYEYGQTKDEEFSIVLGFKLATYNDNSRKAAINSVQNALQNETLDQLLDLMFLEKEDWYAQVRNIENALLYQR